MKAVGIYDGEKYFPRLVNGLGDSTDRIEIEHEYSGKALPDLV